jgi:hypothetical protein
MMNSQTGEAAKADRGALALIGLLLAAATLMVTITAAVAVSDFRGDELSVATLPAAVNTSVAAR